LATRPVFDILVLPFTILTHGHDAQLNITLEVMLGLESIPPLPSTGDAKPAAHDSRLALKRMLTMFERVAFTLLSVGVSILVPEFSAVMAFLGSFSAFVICVIGPILAKMMLSRRVDILDTIILSIAIVMAIWGTVAAFWSP
jgi:solute carrier family 32 (vesicular inhibitory amino acid transporter)